eukprot:CAMPEP_0172328898 /NCGR_PEP_ID=MMETSP1058-20130122/60595_1 /TAXON_ID=83371 /ORGANISM="Detonula confervacea, Strain CCMP 353" /LENGTH=65 /DNA_ID=CAMNT_0013046035 /DNA_START=468 /DNA_END=668 /DNA_ORIENTATION=-
MPSLPKVAQKQLGLDQQSDSSSDNTPLKVPKNRKKRRPQSNSDSDSSSDDNTPLKVLKKRKKRHW